MMRAAIEKAKRFWRRQRPTAGDIVTAKALWRLARNLGWDRESRTGSWHHTELSPAQKKTISDAIGTLHAYFGPAMPPGYRGGWDAFFEEDEGYLSCDAGDLEEALSRIRCGQIDDCLHQLERALPEGYGEIAERLAKLVRTNS